MPSRSGRMLGAPTRMQLLPAEKAVRASYGAAPQKLFSWRAGRTTASGRMVTLPGMDTPQPGQQFEIGIDIGGTFTDVVCRGTDGSVRLTKIPTTRANPSAGIRQALEHMTRDWSVGAQAIARFVHGTTIATNAVLERKGAKLGLLTTAGFKDVLEIGRQSRRDMYDLRLKPQTPVFLAPGALRKE